MAPRTQSSSRPGPHVLTTVALVGAGIGALLSGVAVRHLCLTFTLDMDDYVPTGYDYRTTAACLVVTVAALVLLSVVACAGRGAPGWVLVTLAVLITLAVAVAVHDVAVAGGRSDQGDPGANILGVGAIWLLVPTTWPLVLVVLVRPLAALRGRRQVTGRSSLAPR